MRLIEVRTIESRPKQQYIRNMMDAGKIKRYVTERGFVAFDEKELGDYQENHHKGRPPKNKSMATNK